MQNNSTKVLPMSDSSDSTSTSDIAPFKNVRASQVAEDFGITREDIGHAFAQNMSMQQLSQLLCIASLHKTMEQLDKYEFDRQETLVIIDVAAQGNMERMIDYRERFDHPTDDVLVRSLLIKELFK